MSDERSEQDNLNFDQSFWDELKRLEEEDEWSVIADLNARAMDRLPTSVELDYLLRRYAYLELCDALAYQPKLVDAGNMQFIKVKNDWLIHDHGSVLRAAPGDMTYNPLEQMGKEEKHKGHGTIVQQYVDTTRAMLAIAQSRWQGAKVLAGYRPMQFAAYLIAQASGYILEGVELTESEMRTYHYVKERIPPIPSQSPEVERMPR